MRVDILSCSDCKFLSAIASTTVLSSYDQPAGLRRGKPTRKSVDAKFLCRSSLKNSNGDSRRREVRFSRRLANLICSSLLLLGANNLQEEALAVQQNQLAGRVPGLSFPDENGMRTYRRPDTKSGGHGVGWSPIIPYSFKVPSEWEEVPVSIADLGGTEIDLRFANKKEGNLSVVVAPILRFADTDSATIREIGPPEKVIYAFGPELIGQNVEGKVKSAQVMQEDGREYYHYELEAPHALVTATAAGNRLYLMTVSANSLQWKKHFPNLKIIADSFRVD